MSVTEFPLFRLCPQLEASLPRLCLSPGPSPVAPLDRLRRHLGGGPLWVKNDGLYGTVYGGNKPRKLEFILAHALRKGAGTIVTFGAVGTHHGLATALYGGQHGLRVVLLLTYQFPQEETLRQLCWMQEAGAVLHYTGSIPRTVVQLPLILARYAQRRPLRWPYLLWPGASSPRGCLGYVNAALELAEQIREGQLPEPGSIVVPVASAGTAAGLLLGLRLAGLRSRLLAVRVTRAPTATAGAVARLAASTGRLMRRLGAEGIPRVRPADVLVLREWLGTGYGQPSSEGERARELLAETEGLVLEPTYTAKAAAALIGLRQRGELDDAPVLYWHTFNAVPSTLREPDGEAYLRLPRAFQRFLGAAPSIPRTR